MRALAVLIVSLVLAAPAAAGGWATVGLGPPSDGTGAGDTWNAQMTILQHGNAATPLVGLAPEVIIRNSKRDEHRFVAKPTDKPGVYVAKVTFPREGTWRYFVNDDFSRTHGFPAVQIGAGTGVADGGGSSLPVWPFVAGGLLVALALALYFGRRLRPVTAPAAQP
jgi:hypothetical protein